MNRKIKNTPEEIIAEFLAVLNKWLKSRASGKLSLEFDINQSGITDWNIRTMGKVV